MFYNVKKLFHDAEHHVAHLVVDDALARNGAFFETVERGRIVLVIDDDDVGIFRCENLFRLAFVQLTEFFSYIYASKIFRFMNGARFRESPARPAMRRRPPRSSPPYGV